MVIQSTPVPMLGVLVMYCVGSGWGAGSSRWAWWWEFIQDGAHDRLLRAADGWLCKA